MSNKFNSSKLALIIMSALYLKGGHVHAGDLKLNAGVTSNAVFQQIESDSVGNRDLSTLTIEPNLTAVFRGANFTGSFNGTATHLERDNNDLSTKNNYAEYNYNANWAIVDRLFNLQASGNSRYLNTNTANYLVSDFLVNSEDLAETRTNRIAAVSNIAGSGLVAGTGSFSYTDVRTDETALTNTNRLNNETLAFVAALRNGDQARTYVWTLNGNYSDTDRSRVELGSFESENATGYIDKQVYRNWALRLTGQHESHTFIGNDSSLANERSFDSYGAGVTYRQSRGRSVSLTMNKASSSNAANDGDTFAGVAVEWAFTPRTQLAASFGKRFYGDSANVQFTHAAKHLRTSISYSEDVRNFSQLLADPEVLGVFVCPDGSAGIFDCFQPGSLNYIPQAGEQIVQIIDDNNAIEDSVILRKGGDLEIGYQSRKLMVAFYAKYINDNYLAQERQRETRTVGIKSSYNIGVFTSLTADLSFADIERESVTQESGTSENMKLKLGVTHKLTRRFDITSDISYTDQNGEIGSSRLGSNFTNKQISFGVSYRY
ncbi:TIGR03016 family PEP-CTERM system-associated outer membrane protein [Alteromonas pelagimontana]|uniref:TIGR03016 family PEP-CTERM system-associated outer membrane protein n=1 Tax=Alteromonas pelagimontana TaxID=1858656 RepID=A0A6M4MFW9_9ALTE|nr:TIGR03016 family PEP-CTERM system-associated outer membrane protein [Alteromonas pelagimontana]QJR81962.1 TIGR03016 family PEP-CTERM system-associated outer membrane protein [Alteromonas pelagimontana]